MTDNKKKLKKKVPSNNKKKKKSSGKISVRSKILIALAIIASVALLAVFAAWLILQHYINKMDYIADEEVTRVALEDLPTEEGDDDVYLNQDVTDADGNVVGSTIVGIDIDELTPEEQESIQNSIEAEAAAVEEQHNQAATIPIASADSVYNLLLIGIDNRAGQNWNGNSDAIILVSINSNKRTIYMTSFMRDLYANIPGVGVSKLNKAHAVGAGPLLVQTISENYRIAINNYARVNFYSLISIVDSIGGIDMAVRGDEANYMNCYITEMCSGAGISADPYYLSGGGNLHLCGMQAVAYARVRYAGNSDYERTERQRKVLMAMFAKLQTRSVSEINNFLNTALPLVTHNIPADQITSLIVNAPTYLTYNVISSRIPYDGLYSTMGEMLVPNFEATINQLHATIY